MDVSVRMVAVGVQMMSAGRSKHSTCSEGMSSLSSESWADVTTGVASSIALSCRSTSYSSPSKPPKGPNRQPVAGLTAMDPTTKRSIFNESKSSIGTPNFFTPASVTASWKCSGSIFLGSSKLRLRKPACGTTSCFPALSTERRTWPSRKCGFTRTTLAILNSARSSTRSAATSKPCASETLLSHLRFWMCVLMSHPDNGGGSGAVMVVSSSSSSH
mmetsp:Transcript_80370/g.225534  ORF Transcript_80370/g.225534 Transcript_80370/m.225534 type:complete len:216 (+) Transcript_80370:334-981(+)